MTRLNVKLNICKDVLLNIWPRIIFSARLKRSATIDLRGPWLQHLCKCFILLQARSQIVDSLLLNKRYALWQICHPFFSSCIPLLKLHCNYTLWRFGTAKNKIFFKELELKGNRNRIGSVWGSGRVPLDRALLTSY